ncbi:MAG: DUF1800 domain-containing protein [Planctomycetes bacterium]|nr:DUF1800 domain-containing protein [Planctomycetota bacterium]
MNPSRRRLLRAGGAGAAALALAGCEGALSRAASLLGQGVPGTIDLAAGESPDPAFHLLARAAMGPRPGEVEEVRAAGAAAWIEAQLAADLLDDGACELRARRFESPHLPPGDAFEFKREVILREHARATLLRAVYSRRRLRETMAAFWSDHFNLDTGKGSGAWLVPSHDRDAVRRHALGSFRELLRASALSPAMLVYLDGKENRVRRPGDRPNENFARELLELHTLGVRGGYTQGDVVEAARCLSGWHLREGREWRRGSVEFRAGDHDDGAKTVLGRRIPAGAGEEDVDLLLGILCDHPATSRHVARRLCRRLVADDPPEPLVERAAAAFRAADLAVGPLLRTILLSEEFAASRGGKVKRPLGFVVSALRALAADTHAGPALLEFLSRLGQPPFQYPTPDGYPEEPEPWMGTLLWRWNFALALPANRVAGTTVDLAALVRAAGGEGAVRSPADLAPLLLGRRARAAERAAVEGHARGPLSSGRDRFAEGVGLLLASPGFQAC